jgi:hypothetical protein
MKTWLIEETVSVTYFHRVKAETEEEAREKFYNDEDVEFNVRDEFYGDDTILEINEE